MKRRRNGTVLTTPSYGSISAKASTMPKGKDITPVASMAASCAGMRRAAAAIADLSGFANSDSGDSNELQRQVSDLWIAACSGTEAKSVENFKHCRVLRQNLGSQLFQSRVAGDCEQVTHERRPDPLALMGIDHDKRQFGLAGLRNDVAASARDHGLAVFVDLRNQSNVIGEIDVHEKGDLLVGEASLGNKKAALQRLDAGAVDRSEHVFLVVRP